jgi:hypothetical protein
VLRDCHGKIVGLFGISREVPQGGPPHASAAIQAFAHAVGAPIFCLRADARWMAESTEIPQSLRLQAKRMAVSGESIIESLAVLLGRK